MKLIIRRLSVCPDDIFLLRAFYWSNGTVIITPRGHLPLLPASSCLIMILRTCLTVRLIVYWILFYSALVLTATIATTPKSKKLRELRNSWLETKFPTDKNYRKSDQFLRNVYDPSLNPNAGLGPRDSFSSVGRRQELRALSRVDLQQFREALIEMKTTPAVAGSPGISEYDLIVSKHEITRAPAAHFGCGFTLWHRIYLIGFERALQRHRPGLMLPYLDTRLDSRLPEPSHSVIWSDQLIGTSNGHVTTGFGAGWKVYPATCGIDGDDRLQRGVEEDAGLLLYGNDLRKKFVETPRSFRNFTAPYNMSDFEMSHSMIHLYLGGQMEKLSCSPNDPCFWMHHCFVDHLLDELLRNSDFDKTYPVGTDVNGTPVPQSHRRGDPLFPFEGYSLTDVSHKQFTDVDYAYERSPGDIRCTRDSHCRSEFLWCNPPQCVSKVRNGGFCGWLPVRSCYCTAGKRARKSLKGFCICE